MSRPRKYPSELVERKVRMVAGSGRPMAHVARGLGITSEAFAEACPAVADRGERPAILSASEREKLRTLRRENAQLRQANAISKDATGYFAAEVDPTRQ
jgi:transposase